MYYIPYLVLTTIFLIKFQSGLTSRAQQVHLAPNLKQPIWGSTTTLQKTTDRSWNRRLCEASGVAHVYKLR